MELLEKYMMLKELTKELMDCGDIKNYVKVMIELEKTKTSIMPFYSCN
jgi:hypothetical protein